ncbi:hypothetical protein BDV32DRAFT_132330 [Aspergillus pseudonomiae]|uniref:Uncharacterized protein n=1 Tax=Aspergillus pseudonomiae TaxID=1506151 RepID=A0A5N7CSX6_9EURO|nr:uncharacterized protein BDV37DRAFT_289511 [Aspergillus pseudonomiae]KAB8254492.1 hypothetical protein BDV32DRAFT_132330 [Aspergillus pseudonomiae]KAE8397342.1 hypothetical protein BDV37DRAFT_289511 [Aspergillus pseudonomiae]
MPVKTFDFDQRASGSTYLKSLETWSYQFPDSSSWLWVIHGIRLTFSNGEAFSAGYTDDKPMKKLSLNGDERIRELAIYSDQELDVVNSIYIYARDGPDGQINAGGETGGTKQATNLGDRTLLGFQGRHIPGESLHELKPIFRGA